MNYLASISIDGKFIDNYESKSKKDILKYITTKYFEDLTKIYVSVMIKETGEIVGYKLRTRKDFHWVIPITPVVNKLLECHGIDECETLIDPKTGDEDTAENFAIQFVKEISEKLASFKKSNNGIISKINLD